jgi:hypothetical protein
LQRQRLDLALRGIALDLAPAVRPAQVLLVDVLDAGPPEIVVREVAVASSCSVIGPVYPMTGA